MAIYTRGLYFRVLEVNVTVFTKWWAQNDFTIKRDFISAVQQADILKCLWRKIFHLRRIKVNIILPGWMFDIIRQWLGAQIYTSANIHKHLFSSRFITLNCMNKPSTLKSIPLFHELYCIFSTGCLLSFTIKYNARKLITLAFKFLCRSHSLEDYSLHYVQTPKQISGSESFTRWLVSRV